MEKAFEFDFVFDVQFVFRKVLDSMARPMKINSLDKLSDSFEEDSFLCALGCTLVDNEVAFYVEKDPKFSNNLSALTLSKEQEIDKADYIFLTSEMNYESVKAIFSKAKKGTLYDPQLSATIIIACDSLVGNEAVKIKSPGIDGVCEKNVSTYIRTIFEIKQGLDVEYPCGIDLIFIDGSGDFFCYPRLASIAKGEK